MFGIPKSTVSLLLFNESKSDLRALNVVCKKIVCKLNFYRYTCMWFHHAISFYNDGIYFSSVKGYLFILSCSGNFLSHILHMAMAPIHGTSRFTCIISNICCIMPIGVIFARPRLFSDSSPRALRWAVTSVSSGIMSFKCTSLMILPSLDISDAALLRISSTPV